MTTDEPELTEEAVAILRILSGPSPPRTYAEFQEVVGPEYLGTVQDVDRAMPVMNAEVDLIGAGYIESAGWSEGAPMVITEAGRQALIRYLRS